MISMMGVHDFEMVHKKPKLLPTVRERKLEYFRHSVRRNGKQGVLSKGNIERTRKRGREVYVG